MNYVQSYFLYVLSVVSQGIWLCVGNTLGTHHHWYSLGLRLDPDLLSYNYEFIVPDDVWRQAERALVRCGANLSESAA